MKYYNNYAILYSEKYNLEDMMTRLIDWVANLWTYSINQVKAMGIADIIDIALVSVLIYYVYKFIRERRAGKLAVGIAMLAFMTMLSNVFELNVINYFMKNIFQVGLIAAVVIFQPELRSLLENVGGDSIKRLRSLGEDREYQHMITFINELCEAVGEMSMSKTGALIVIERSTKLGDIISTGTVINADTSSMLIRNIFFNKSPLHDGAVVIRDQRIHAAGCLLPLATKNNITKELGTRHRAAIGASEASDALVVVVSEETGTISLAHKGHLHRGYDAVRLKAKLDSLLLQDKTKKIIKTKKKNSKQ